MSRSEELRRTEGDGAQARPALEALDYLLIKRVAARWNHAVARQDNEAFLRCFTTDATMRISHGLKDELSGTCRGQFDVSRYLDLLSSAFATERPRVWHNLPVIEGDSKFATFQAYFLVFIPREEEIAWIGSGIHRDSLRKEGDDWHFVDRSLEIEHSEHGDWPETAMASLETTGVKFTPTPGFFLGEGSEIGFGNALDHELILQALARYNFCWDQNRIDEWIDLFTKDAVFRVFGVDELYKSSSWHAHAMPTVYSGRNELANFIQQAAVGKSEDRERHWNGLPLIRIKGDRATAYVQCMTRTAGRDEECRTIVTNLYRDRLRKVNGRWLFEERIAMPEAVSDRASLAKERLGGIYMDSLDEGPSVSTDACCD